MTGPKALPIRDVPIGWMANSATSMATVAGRIMALASGKTISNPSSAERTEMAGVMAPSP